MVPHKGERIWGKGVSHSQEAHEDKAVNRTQLNGLAALSLLPLVVANNYTAPHHQPQLGIIPNEYILEAIPATAMAEVP